MTTLTASFEAGCTAYVAECADEWRRRLGFRRDRERVSQTSGTKIESSVAEPDQDAIAECVARIKLGRRDEFAKIVEWYQSKVRGYCTLVLGDRARGEDAAQDVFVKAFQRIASVRGDASFSAWLMTLARNHCIDELRKNRRNREVSMETLVGDEPGRASAIEFAHGARTPDTESGELVAKILNHLAPNHREILLLKELYGYSYEDLCQILDLSLDGVKGQLKRARAKAVEILRHLSEMRDVARA